MLNRSLMIVRMKQPFADWVNEADPQPDSNQMTLAQVNEDNPVFLIHDWACEDVEGWLEQCYLPLFEEILEQWYLDESLWPQERTLKRFRAWCEIEVHSMVIDVVDEPLKDDDYELGPPTH